MNNNQTKRTIRSFVLRQGRMTVAQQQAMDTQWPHYGIDFTPEVLDFSQLFANENPVTVEIGFGMGESLLDMAEQYSNRNFLGIEVHGPGVGALLAGIEKRGLSNLRVIRHDAVEVLSTMIADGCVERFQIFFPDPWHKKRHHKRRLIQSDFVKHLVTKLQPHGYIHCATDWQPYAEYMMSVLSAEQGLSNCWSDGRYVDNQDLRPSTKFEKRGERLGHGVWDLLFQRFSG